MRILFYAIQFIETSLLFSALAFSAIMYFRTKDALARRTVWVLFPVTAVLFISYMYTISSQVSDIDNGQLAWLSPLGALVVIALIMVSIFTTCHYIIQLFPISPKRKRTGLIASAVLVGALLIITTVLVMYISKADISMAITNALWAFYPLCSLALFFEAVALASKYKKITNIHDQKLAKDFLIAFMPQIFFSVADFLLLRHISFQLTHLSYTIFSLFVFIDLSSYFFKYYNKEIDVTANREQLKEEFALSDREIDVVVLLAQGMTNPIIGERLHISVNTVKSHIKRIYKKMDISNRLQLIKVLSSIQPNSNGIF